MAALYRGMDRETLDRQYNARATVPDIGPFLKAYADLSAAARAELPCHPDIRYGDRDDEVMDIFPAGRDAPVFVFLHGGYWRLLSKDDSAFMARCLTEKGVAVAALNYSLAPAATIDIIVDQVRRALAYLWRHGRDFGFDPGRIHVGGSSAGGQLVGMLLAPDWHDRYGVPETVIAGALSSSGLFEMEPLRLCHPNEWLQLDQDMASRNSPMLQIPQGGPPLIVVWGETDTGEFKRHSRDYAGGYAKAGGDVTAFEIAGCNHFDNILTLADPDSRLTASLLAMIERE